jgi:transcriptional regulator with XRE-family HTH domain
VNDKDILRVVGGNIQNVRLHAGMTQECLAELVGIHAKTLGYIENGKHPFSVATFARIVQFLRVNPSELLEGLSVPDKKRAAAISKAKARRRKPRKV